jgi:hypothetical protein
MAEKSRASESPYFWPATVLLVAVAVSLSCWAIYNLLPGGAEKALRMAQIPPKFNHTSKEVSASKSAVAHKPEVLPEPRRITMAFASAEPPLFPPPLEAPPLLPPLPPMDFQPARLIIPEPLAHAAHVPDSKVLVYLESTTTGDTPMLRTWKSLALYSLLTSTVYVQVPAPVHAQDIDGAAIKKSLDGLQKTIDDSVADVKKDIKELRRDYEALKKIKDNADNDWLTLNRKIEEIEKSLKAIRNEMDGIRNAPPPVAKSGIDKDSVEDIKKQLVAIEQAILKLMPSGPGRISLASPAPNVPTTGRVVLMNNYTEDLLFIINGKGHRVAPGTNRPIEVGAGNIVYEVVSSWGPTSPKTITLAPNDNLILTANR